jgi:hypothetical protein
MPKNIPEKWLQIPDDISIIRFEDDPGTGYPLR